MKVLVGYASKYGATDAVAHQIGAILSELGLDVMTARLGNTKVEGYDAYIIGSAIYAGNWLKDARRFVDRNLDELRAKRTWFFSSGPIGRPLKPEGEPAGIEDFIYEVMPEDHAIFAGKLEKAHLNLLEKAMASVFQAPEGDFRDWDAIARWAIDVGDALIAQSTSTTITAGR